MNFDDRCQYANNDKTQENSEYGKSEVRCSTSRNTQCELFMSQKGFLLCESCLWCASSLYRIEDEDKDKDKISPFLQCPIVLIIKLNYCLFYNSYSMVIT
jgi:hypothetical protein